MVIFVSGTSSSGKSSICKLLQEHLGDGCILFSVDKYLSMLGQKYDRIFNNPNIYTHQNPEIFEPNQIYYAVPKDNGTFEIKYGDISHKFFAIIPNIVLEIAKQRLDVIVDAFVESKEHIRHCKEVLRGFDAKFIYLYASREEISRREKNRSNRLPGTGENWLMDFDCIDDCDIVKDTTQTNPQTITDEIIKTLKISKEK